MVYHLTRTYKTVSVCFSSLLVLITGTSRRPRSVWSGVCRCSVRIPLPRLCVSDSEVTTIGHRQWKYFYWKSQYCVVRLMSSQTYLLEVRKSLYRTEDSVSSSSRFAVTMINSYRYLSWPVFSRSTVHEQNTSASWASLFDGSQYIV